MVDVKNIRNQLVDLIASWGYERIHIPWGSMKASVLDSIIDWINNNANKPAIGVHVGNYLGISLGILSLSLKEHDQKSLIIAIDPDLPCRGQHETEKATTMLLQSLDVEDMVLRLTGYSLWKSISGDGFKIDPEYDPKEKFDSEVAAQWQLENLAKLFTSRADFVLLDGNHEKDYLTEEVLVSYNLLRPGGAIFVDDITRHYKGVESAFHEFASGDMFTDSFTISDEREVRTGVLIK